MADEKPIPLPETEETFSAWQGALLVWFLILIFGLLAFATCHLFWPHLGPWVLVASCLIGLKYTFDFVNLTVTIGPSGFVVRRGREVVAESTWADIESVTYGLWSFTVVTKNHRILRVPSNVEHSSRVPGLYSSLLFERRKCIERPKRKGRTLRAFLSCVAFLAVGVPIRVAIPPHSVLDADHPGEILWMRMALLSLAGVLIYCGAFGTFACLLVWGLKAMPQQWFQPENEYQAFLSDINPGLKPVEMATRVRYRYGPVLYIKERGSTAYQVGWVFGVIFSLASLVFIPVAGIAPACLVVVAAAFVIFRLRPSALEGIKRVTDQFEVAGDSLVVYRGDERLVFGLTDCRAISSKLVAWTFPYAWKEEYRDGKGGVYVLDRRFLVPIEDEARVPLPR